MKSGNRVSNISLCWAQTSDAACSSWGQTLKILSLTDHNCSFVWYLGFLQNQQKEVKNNAVTYNFPISQLPKKVQAEIRLGQFCWGTRLVRYSARGPLLLVVWIGNYVGRNSWGHIIWITSGLRRWKCLLLDYYCNCWEAEVAELWFGPSVCRTRTSV